MTPERFRQIEELYHAAREKTGAERAALLAEANPEMRREVEDLLAQTESGFLAAPAVPISTELADATVTALTGGNCLGPYRIESKLGEGGMGEVFRAVDTRLGRTVAVKVTHAKFGDRFEREARAIAALNHPHICTLHDVGPDYLVMEFIEGETLAQRLKRGKLSMEETLRYGAQIASALAAAHAKGIVHRDLKPGNIMLVNSGVKVLDFGLAKTQQDETITASRAVMGTPGYMAPEQREGNPADARTDIYSLGCVFYEMATGGRIGSGQRVPSRSLEKIVNHCLEQDPGRRWQSVAELEHALSALNRRAPHEKAIAAAALTMLVLGAGGYFYLQRAPKLTDKDTIVLADFENKTGDPVFDDTLRQGLIVQLQQSPYLSLVPDQKIRATLKLMGKPVGSALNGEAAREVCQRIGATAMLTGTIASLGSQYVMSLRAEGCASGESLDNEQAQASGKEQVLSTLGDMAGKFRARTGESLAAIREHNVPLEEGTTSSLEALKAYTAGVDKAAEAAISQLRRATELDPQFAAAWSLLAIQYSGLGETALSRQSAIRAYQARDRASGPEKFNIEYSYHRNVTGNLEKAWQSISLWRQTYPRDPKAFSLSGGYAANGTGRFEEALQTSEQSVVLDPGQLYGYLNSAGALYHLGRFEEAEKAFAVAAAHHATAPDAMALRYRLALRKRDKAGMERILAESRGNLDNEMELEQVQALAAAQDGRLKEAETHSRSVIEMALRAGLRERTAVSQAAPAVWNALYENNAAARRTAEVALRTFEGREVSYAAGFALGLAGDAAKAEVLADKLDKEYPEDTQVQATYVPTLRALAALHKNDPRKAIDLLEANRSYEFGIPPLAFVHFYGNMYPIYVRGLAYLAMRKAQEAAAEFSRLLAHPGLAFGDPVDAAARRQLARALELAGSATKARAAYQDFLTSWQEADPDSPILKQAKVEYARLP
ncbi:MAG TPA: serine/threonine-protein kinase [Bryobacteraceae bacterium]|nr:serine/threonine-protein kinase [Bryobacteraceae bacterium]